MIEEIKKEIDEMFIYDIRRIKGTKKYIELIDKGYVLGIIDKHDNQPDYKSAFQDLRRYYSNQPFDIKVDSGRVLQDIKELEQKYNLGGE